MNHKKYLLTGILCFVMSNSGFAMVSIKEEKIKMIRERAAADTGWKKEEISVEPVSILDHGGCTFFSASSQSALDGPHYSYALLPSGVIIGEKDARHLEKILSVCGHDANALWWAGVINHHADTGGVLVTEKESPLVAKDLKKITGKNVDPQIIKSPNEVIVHFYTHEYQRNRSYHVQAKWSSSGHLSLTKTLL